MNKKLIAILIVCIFGITFTSPVMAYENLPNTDDEGCDIISYDSGFDQLAPGEMIIDPTSGISGDLNNLNGASGLKILLDYIYYNFDWKHGAATTADGVITTGYGDCWGLTDFSKMILEANGYTVKVQQLKTKESNNHRRLLVLLNGKWVTFDSSLCTKHYKFKPY
ncbi:transglutaminase domain-containing protein [Methanobacterium sp. MBAC-LM]|uniref:transglutaminase domain-containing protein n=1 Tax=Methanobacterium sp. MBAC-LM TaxID=3412034 RepID=UPI003C71033E